MVVTSVLQTTAGKMIFGRVEDQKAEMRDAKGEYRDRPSKPLPAPAPSID
jgi:hypothetical protein